MTALALLLSTKPPPPPPTGLVWTPKAAPPHVNGGFGSAPPFASVPINNVSASDLVIVFVSSNYNAGITGVSINDGTPHAMTLVSSLPSGGTTALSIWKYTGTIFTTPTISVVCGSIQHVGISVGVLSGANPAETNLASFPLQTINDPGGVLTVWTTTTPLTVPAGGMGLIQYGGGGGRASSSPSYVIGTRDFWTYGVEELLHTSGYLAATDTPTINFPGNNFAGIIAAAWGP